jgi:molybdopterin converting factor small subunit
MIIKAKSDRFQTRRGPGPALNITVKYSLPFREEVGVREETYEIGKNPANVASVLSMIVRRHSCIGKFVDAASDEAQRRQMVIALNSRLARLSDVVHDGDSVSLLLPVTGGSKKR